MHAPLGCYWLLTSTRVLVSKNELSRTESREEHLLVLQLYNNRLLDSIIITLSEYSETEFLLVTTGSEILKVYPKFIGTHPEHTLAHTGLYKVTVLDYHWEQGMVYYADTGRSVIARRSFKSTK